MITLRENHGLSPRSSRPRVLYVTHRVPYPPDKGDRIRNFHVLRQLSRWADVSLASLADEPVPESTVSALTDLCQQVAIVPVSKWTQRWSMGWSLLRGRSLSEGAFSSRTLTDVCRQWHAQRPFDAALVSASSLAPLLRDRDLASIPGFVDLVDVDSQKWADYASSHRGVKSWLFRLEANRVQSLESELARWAAACSVVSRPEADLLDRVAGAGTATVATNGVDLDYFQPVTCEESLAVAFVGALDYEPNVDAAEWFVREIWPAIRAAEPTAEFRLIGRKPVSRVQQLARHPGVTLVGQVPDVRIPLASSAVSVVPLRIARGIQNKVLESLALGKATVVSPPALAAIAATPGHDLLRAESKEDWIASVCDLLRNPARRQMLGSNGRTFVEQHHRWETCLEPLMSLLRDACEIKIPETRELAATL